jgi:hypothetical protein
MSEELKPCPFCGDKRVAIHFEHDPDGFGKFSMVRCHACGAQSQGVFASTGNDCPLHYEEVRDAWNTRSTQATPDAAEAGKDAAAVQAVQAVGADAKDAARWRMLPAFFEEYQIDAMKLYRDIDASLDEAAADLPGMWEASDLIGGATDVPNGTGVSK